MKKRVTKHVHEEGESKATFGATLKESLDKNKDMKMDRPFSVLRFFLISCLYIFLVLYFFSVVISFISRSNLPIILSSSFEEPVTVTQELPVDEDLQVKALTPRIDLPLDEDL